MAYATWPFKEGFDPSILQDTGIRFLQPFTPPIIPPSLTQQVSQAGVSIAQGAQAVSRRAFELEAAAIRGMVNFGQSATATAIQVAQADLAALQGMADIAEPFMPPVVRNTRDSFFKKSIEALSQIEKAVTTTTTVVGQTPQGAFAAVLQEETRSQPFLLFKKSGTIAGAGLTGLQVVQAYQNPALSSGERHTRAGVEVGTFGIKLGVGEVIGLALKAFGASTPVTFGISILAGGVIGGVIDGIKERVLKHNGLSP